MSPSLTIQLTRSQQHVTSCPAAGMIEYWSAQDYAFPKAAVNFKFKTETDLYMLAKAKTQALSLAVSRDGTQFAMLCADRWACICCCSVTATAIRQCLLCDCHWCSSRYSWTGHKLHC